MADNFEMLVQNTPDLDGVLTAFTRDEDLDKNRVLHANRTNSIGVHWRLTGSLIDDDSLTGSWELQAHFEGMGTANEFEVPAAPQVEPWHANGVYNVSIPIPADTIVPGNYKIVVSLTHLNNNGTPTRMSGFVEIPMVRFI